MAWPASSRKRRSDAKKDSHDRAGDRPGDHHRRAGGRVRHERRFQPRPGRRSKLQRMARGAPDPASRRSTGRRLGCLQPQPETPEEEMTTDPLLKWREEFPILAKKTYLINNSLGAMPRKVREGLKHFADMWDADGVVAWHYPDGSGWLHDCEKTADLVGSIV